jgi:hypothetical protein
VNFIAILLEDEQQSSAQKPLKHCRRLPHDTQMTQKTIHQIKLEPNNTKLIGVLQEVHQMLILNK